jgi:hypothetical protein
MNRIFHGLILTLALFGFAISVEATALQGEREYIGAINKTILIRMKLIENGNTIRGTYVYERIGKAIQLNGTIDGQKVIMYETDAKGRRTGIFTGHFDRPDVIEGTWSNADGTKTLPFSVMGSIGSRPRAASPDDGISGEYARLDAKGRIQKNSGASINVRLLKDGSAKIQGDANLVIDAKRGNVRTGNVEGTYKLEGNRLLVKGEGKYDCSMTLSFGKGTLEVSDDNNQCGGLGVNFDGAYKRIGPPKFQ